MFRRTAMATLGVVGLALGAVLLPSPPASAATLTEVTNFGANPTNLRMHLYVPDRVAAKPAVLVAAHYCTGDGPAFHAGTEFASLADRYGFIVVYPTATRDSKCFDVSSPQALSHDGGSDPSGIVSMVRYVLRNHQGDANRVYATGMSSGAMMTNVLLGAYPDVFKAGAAFAGVPFGCFATSDGSGWNSTCAQGNLVKTPRQWGDLVRAAYPGYTGPRPRMQLWHGTEDDVLRYPNFTAAIEQWTNVAGIGQTPTTSDSPRPNWNRTRYNAGGTVQVEAVSVQGGPHNVLTAGMAQYVMDFFGLSGDQPPSSPCSVTYTTTAWNTGLTANITITNTGASAISGWSLAFTLPTGQTITSGWGATYTPATGTVTAKGTAYNATIAPGASIGIGLQASHTGDSGEPVSFTLNGTPCATG